MFYKIWDIWIKMLKNTDLPIQEIYSKVFRIKSFLKVIFYWKLEEILQLCETVHKKIRTITK